MNLYQDQHQQYIPPTMPPRPMQTETGTMQWQVDVYAPAFVPSFYMQINNMPAISVKSHPPPSIDYPAYISAFAGAAFLKPLLPCPALQPFSMGEGYPLTDDTYFRYFSDLLYRELSSQHEDVRQYNMYNVPLYPYDLNVSQFKLMVPGIREDCPMVAVGDVVHLRQIRTNGFNAYPPMGFTGLQYEAYIYAIDRQAGFLILRIDKLILESGLFNITFLVQEEFLRPHARALFDISKLLSNTRQGFARKMLFPEQSDGIQQTTLNEAKFSHKWFDDELNYEQQKAVDAILQQKYGALPYLISGPPGTGKTKTIVEAALQLLFGQASKNHHIILCAPSNQAADTLTQRLIPHLNPGTLLRLNSCSRSFAEVPIELLTYCYVRNNSFGLPDWRKLMTYKLIVATCKDCSMLVEARCTNRDLARWEKVVTASLRGEELPTLFNGMDVGNWTSPGMGDIKPHWSALLIDEAAQGTEPEILIPFSVIAPPEEYSKQNPVFVMAGDQKQLGPRTASRRAFFETSLFERLFSRQLYSEHPFSRRGITKLGGANASKWSNERTTTLLPYIRPPFTNLIRNYRSHPAILAVPSALFYHDTLVPEATDINGLESWEGWKGRKWPVLFMTNGGQDELHGESVSFYNLREMKIACKTSKSLVESGLLQPHEIAIMSPFREQVRRIRNTLRLPEYGLRDVNVGPLDAFQGSEHKFVIICTTRSRERFLEQDNKKGLGIIFESKKFNVAMTRAKQGLAVIGNPWILQKDPVWLAFLSFCWRNGIVEHDSEEPRPSMRTESTATDSTNASAFQNGTQQKEGSPLSREARPGFAFNATSTNVNLWEPPRDEQDMPQYLSRLEQGLLMKDHLAGFNGYIPSPLGGEFSSMDDPMWTAGIVAEDAMRGVDLDSLNLE